MKLNLPSRWLFGASVAAMSVSPSLGQDLGVNLIIGENSATSNFYGTYERIISDHDSYIFGLSDRDVADMIADTMDEHVLAAYLKEEDLDDLWTEAFTEAVGAPDVTTKLTHFNVHLPMPEVQGYWPVQQTIQVENNSGEDAPFLVDLDDMDVSLQHDVTWNRDLKGFDFSGQTFATNFQVTSGIGHDLTLESVWNENGVNVENLILSIEPLYMSFPPGKWKLEFFLETSTTVVNTGYKVSIENDYTAIVGSDCSGCTDEPIKDEIRTLLSDHDMPVEFTPTLSTLGTSTFRHLNSHTTITYYSGLYYLLTPVDEAATTTQTSSGQAASTEKPPGSKMLETPMNVVAESTRKLQADDTKKYLRRAG